MTQTETLNVAAVERHARALRAAYLRASVSGLFGRLRAAFGHAGAHA